MPSRTARPGLPGGKQIGQRASAGLLCQAALPARGANHRAFLDRPAVVLPVDAYCVVAEGLPAHHVLLVAAVSHGSRSAGYRGCPQTLSRRCLPGSTVFSRRDAPQHRAAAPRCKDPSGVHEGPREAAVCLLPLLMHVDHCALVRRMVEE